MNSGNWRKSTYSSGQGGECVEVGQGHGVLIRDTKNDDTSPTLHFSSEEWERLTRAIG